MLNVDFWKNPEHSVNIILSYYKKNIRMESVYGSGDRKFPTPPDYRDTAKVLIRSGRELTKEEKRNHKIHASAKATTSVFEHFHDKGLPFCIKEATQLALAVSAVEIYLDRLFDWEKWGITMVEFSPAPDACDFCLKLKKTYEIKDIPIPVLNTHLGCRCSFRPAEDSTFLEKPYPDTNQKKNRDQTKKQEKFVVAQVVACLFALIGYFFFQISGFIGGVILGFILGVVWELIADRDRIS